MNKIEILTQELKSSAYKELVDAQDYPEIAYLLNNKPLIPNEEVRKTVPKILSIEDANTLFNLIPDSIALEIGKLPNAYERLISAFSNNDRLMILQNFKTIKSLLTEELKLLIENYLNQTELDPNYKSEVLGQSRAEELGISHITEKDIQAVLNPSGVLHDTE